MLDFPNATSLTAALTPANQDLSNTIQAYWVHLATTGNPNGGGNPTWPDYDTSSDLHLELGANIVAGAHLLSEQADLFEAILLDNLTP
ncbi:MAG: carboxylesterase family protein [Candidatus Hydrogenedentes bacterium]|nr:carboxylesterase family protein [Candidatus Hydrogenedentota bacterium]